MKGNISLKGAGEKPEQSGVTETEDHADKQCSLFAHICMRKSGAAAASGSTSLLVNGWEPLDLFKRVTGTMGAVATLKRAVLSGLDGGKHFDKRRQAFTS